MNPLTHSKNPTILPLLMALALVCFGLLPRAHAVVTDPEDYFPNQTTAVGQFALFNLTSGLNNTANGYFALIDNTSGSSNTAIGNGALSSNTTGFGNTANGALTLVRNTTGGFNVANGVFALIDNTTGSFNTAIGGNALNNNTTGSENTANGLNALFSNTSGSNNTAIGAGALVSNTTGFANTANGREALFGNTTGSFNTANGLQALFGNTTGSSNTANGLSALFSNTTGSENTANGAQALTFNTTGIQNTADGREALALNTTGRYNTAVGFQALLRNTIGSSNIGLGTSAGSSLTTGSGNVCIGVNVFGVAGESNTTRIRNIYSSVASGRAVYVNANNKIGTLVSSRRFKDEIKPMDKASETILALKPVTFRYKKEIEPNGAIMFGLIAEEVEKVAPELVTRDAKGEVETVRYEAVNAMLLNEFLKEHRKVQELQSSATRQEATITQLKSALAQQQKDFQATVALQQEQIEALGAGLQRVSDQLAAASPSDGGLEVSKFATGRIRRGGPAPRTVVSND